MRNSKGLQQQPRGWARAIRMSAARVPHEQACTQLLSYGTSTPSRLTGMKPTIMNVAEPNVHHGSEREAPLDHLGIVTKGTTRPRSGAKVDLERLACVWVQEVPHRQQPAHSHRGRHFIVPSQTPGHQGPARARCSQSDAATFKSCTHARKLILSVNSLNKAVNAWLC